MMTGQNAGNLILRNDRLYQRIARKLFDQLSSGEYAIGDRLPAERELSQLHNVSRPAVREALIALEVQGFIEVRIGSGAFVRHLPGTKDVPGFAITAFEITEARMLFEGESAALAATQITDAELTELDDLLEAMMLENVQPEVTEIADRSFHLTIARATRNAGIVFTIEQLWQLRSTSAECTLLHDKARLANIRPVVAEHAAVVAGLRARDASIARAAMRNHLAAVMDHLLFATEERAVEDARREVANKRARYFVPKTA